MNDACRLTQGHIRKSLAEAVPSEEEQDQIVALIEEQMKDKEEWDRTIKGACEALSLAAENITAQQNGS